MVVDADAVEASVLAAGDEGRDIGQGPANRNPDRHAEPGHWARTCIPSRMLQLNGCDG
jgi:hypothetical protein